MAKGKRRDVLTSAQLDAMKAQMEKKLSELNAKIEQGEAELKATRKERTKLKMSLRNVDENLLKVKAKEEEDKTNAILSEAIKASGKSLDEILAFLK